jgi:small subunit ribosomal protein S18
MIYTPSHKKECYFCKKKLEEVDYTNVEILSHYIAESGKIRPASRTGTCAKHQRKLTKAIKRARQMAIIPYTVK